MAGELITIQDNVITLKFSDSRIPDFKKDKRKPYILFGEENDYPAYLLNLFNKSSKHNAIISGKLNYILGGGLASQDPGTVLWLKQFNRAGETADDIARRSILDIEVFGGFYWQFIFDMAGRVSDIFHVDFKNMRSSEDGTWFYYKRNWADNKEEPKKLPAFDPREPRDSIFFFSEYRPGVRTYCLPGYVGATNYIEADIEVSKHTLTNAKTGFSASKILNFFNGKPTEEAKREIERRFNAHYTGSEGKKIIIAYNEDPNKAPQVLDLGASDLTKEDFAHVDDLIAGNIYSGHQITSPMLFGIQEPGKLGGRNELREAFEIFKNTYVKNKQLQYERIMNTLAEITGHATDIHIVSIDPVGIDFSDNVIIQVAPRSWVLDKMGIDPLKYTDPPAGTKTTTDGTGTQQKQEAAPAAPVNDHLKNLTAKQYQQVERIISRYKKGKLTREQAALLLKASVGLSDSEAAIMLQMDPQTFRAIFSEDEEKEYTEDEVADMFSEVGTGREHFEVVHSKNVLFTTDAEMAEDELNFFQQLHFDADASGNEVPDASLLDSIRKKIDKIAKVEKKLPQIVVRYSYEVAPGNGPAVIEGTRPFCKKLVELDRFYSRKDIEKISERLGYSVWDRRGGFWNHGNGETTPSCRHIWKSNVVIKKN